MEQGESCSADDTDSKKRHRAPDVIPIVHEDQVGENERLMLLCTE